MVYFAYPLENSSKQYEDIRTFFSYFPYVDEEIIVATICLETMLGDTAVVVHPDDKRYKHLDGKYVQHPFLSRRLPILADTMIDPSFGSGTVKRQLLDDLKKRGLYRDLKEHEMILPICSRSKDIIESLLKPQWYVNCKTIAQRSIDAVRSKELKILPNLFGIND